MQCRVQPTFSLTFLVSTFCSLFFLILPTTDKTNKKHNPKLIWTVIYYWPYIFIVLINNIHQHLGHIHTSPTIRYWFCLFLIKVDSLMFYLLDNNGKWLPNSQSRFSPNHLSINVPIRCFCVVEFFSIFLSTNRTASKQLIFGWYLHYKWIVCSCWRMEFQWIFECSFNFLIVNCLIWFTRIKNAPFIWWTNRNVIELLFVVKLFKLYGTLNRVK